MCRFSNHCLSCTCDLITNRLANSCEKYLSTYNPYNIINIPTHLYPYEKTCVHNYSNLNSDKNQKKQMYNPLPQTSKHSHNKKPITDKIGKLPHPVVYCYETTHRRIKSDLHN